MPELRSDLHCTVCNQNIAECTCPGVDDKMYAMAMDPNSHFAAKWCVGCNRYWARCRCAEPQFRLYMGGQQVDPRTVRNLYGQTVADTNPEIGYDEQRRHERYRAARPLREAN